MTDYSGFIFSCTGTELTFEIIENKKNKKSFLTPVRRSIRNKGVKSCTKSSASLLHLNQLLVASKLEQTDFNYQPNKALKKEEEEEMDSEDDVSTVVEEEEEERVEKEMMIEGKVEESTQESSLTTLGSSFVTETLKRKDGSQTRTPVRRSSRLSSKKSQTPVLFG